ncbi:MAG: Mrp/NBP35 family ATP-binding protein [Oscillospiraceae bacterium]|nr:Mrp/NBP35 family ATP-binding protein [Oscillospiraceae bacterium]
MSDCSHNCSSCGESCSSREAPQKEASNANSTIPKVYAIVSGKGGVGKSLVTSLMAGNAARKGMKVGVLDADITGPSIPKAFGITQRAFSDGEAIIPCETEKGTKVMSVNLMLANDTDPVVWRGPVISGVVKQFWTDVAWGDIDCMFIDMPPGTGDVPLTVFQSLPIDGIIIVTSPQELVGMIVEKAVKMAEMMSVPVVGLVENMSYFECPNCKEKHHIYGESHIDEIAAAHGITKVAKIPMQSSLAGLCDAGKIEDYEGDWLDSLSALYE